MVDQSASLVWRANDYVGVVRDFRSGLVLLRQSLNAPLLVTSFLAQILLAIVDFVLVQLQLGLRQIQLAIQFVLLASPRFSVLGRKLCDFRLVGCHCVFRFLQPGLNLLGLTRKDKTTCPRSKLRSAISSKGPLAQASAFEGCSRNASNQTLRVAMAQLQ